MNLCEQLQLHVLISTGKVCEKAETVVSKKAQLVVVELTNMEKLLQRKNVSGATIHAVANIRQRLILLADAIESKGLNSKYKKQVKNVLDDSLKIIKQNEPIDTKTLSKKSKGKNGSSVVAYFHNMY
jgi:hypothetical protein